MGLTKLVAGVVIAFLASVGLGQVPRIDSLAGKWLSGPEIVNPPSVTSTHGTLGCSENLTGFRYCVFPPIAQGGEAAELLVDGKPVMATRFRWYPYQALRETKAENGLELSSTTRLAADKNIVLISLVVKNPTAKAIDASLQLRSNTAFRRCEGTWDWSNRGVNPQDGFEHKLVAGHETIHDSKSGLDAILTQLPEGTTTFPGHSARTFLISCSFSPLGPKEFDKEFSRSKADWEDRWVSSFRPGNKRYPGNFPTLVTRDEKLKRVYYLALMTMLQMERTSFAHSHRCFVTVGPEYGTTLEYFWDTALFATTYTMLDPVSFKENLNSWLNIDIHHHYAIDYLTGQGVGPWYSPNDFSVFTAFWNYAVASGDHEFLMANKQHFIDWAMAWKSRMRPGETLADFGDNDNILECGPAYVNMIPSLNAAHVGLMRQAMQLTSGNQARLMNTDANNLSRAVLQQYVPGDGVWKTKHRDGNSVVCRHVYDYLTIGMAIPGDLSPTMKREMTGFVNRELLAEGWIRAMSLSDEAAAISDRPDHGPKGSYCAWPALAALTMFKFGQDQDAVNLIDRCEGATWQGPFPQAFELLQVPGTKRWIPRISLRGADYNETSGAAFAETVIHGLFGIEFDLEGKVVLTRAGDPKPVEARLLNVRTKRGLQNFRCGKAGIKEMT